MKTLLFIMLLFQDEIPYKGEDEFKVSFELAFRKRTDANADFITPQLQKTPLDRTDTSPLPYLSARLEVIKQSADEVKIKVVRDNEIQVLKRKIEPGVKVNLFGGFVDDIKDQVSGYKHTVYFLSKKGDTLSKIVIEFDEEGFYLVNGKKKGKL
jgi:hypothetical protein